MIAGILSGALAAIVALLAAWMAGRKTARTESALAAAERYAKTQKEIDNADLGIGASDQQRIDRLREFADGE